MSRRFCKRCLLLVILSGITGAMLYLSSAAFSERWQSYVVEQLEQRGLHVAFERMSLSLVRGLVVREVRIYNDSAREHLLAALDRVNVEFDYGQLMRGRAHVEGIELVRANVALPVDPEQPELTVIELRDFSARVFLRDRQLELVHATGELAGIRLDVSASVRLGAEPATEEERASARAAAARRLQVLREYRVQIHRVLDWLGRFEFSAPPILVAKASGAADSLDDFEVDLDFEVRDFAYRSYRCQELLVEAGLAGGVANLRKLRLVDALGSLDATASWRRGEEEIDFRLTSNADMTSAAEVLLGIDSLREVVFYEQGPSLALEGRFFFGNKGAALTRPLDARGEIHCPRFTSRGEVFEGLSANFGVNNDGIYVRDGVLRHRSGSLGLQLLLHEQQGLRYRATLKMDPAAFKPFVQNEKTRALIDRFKFDRDSSIYVKLEGGGPSAKFSECRSTGIAELRAGEHRGLRFERAEGRFEFQGPHLIFRNVKAELPNGFGEADEVEVDSLEKWVRLKGVRAQCDAVPVLRSFAPMVADPVAVYQLPAGTVINVDGMFGWQEPEQNDCRVIFAAAEGSGTYRLWDRDYHIEAPQGELQFKADELEFDVRGQVFGGAMQAKGKTDLSKDRDEFDVTVKTEAFEHHLFGRDLTFRRATATVGGREGEITFDTQGTVLDSAMTVRGRANKSAGKDELDLTLTTDALRWPVFGKDLDFEQASAQVSGRGGEFTFDATSRLLGGQFEAKGRTDTRPEHDHYAAEVKINTLSFARFAQTYAPAYETEGDLTGHFNFEGVDGDPRSLRGEGVAIILNGNLYAVPILGPLTPLLGGFLPAPIKGYNVAKEANCTFTVQDGRVYTSDVEALTAAFRLVAKGNADFVDDKVEFDAQARIRGLPGLVFRPVSELLEYHARGSIGDPQWKSRLFSLGDGEAETEAQNPAASANNPKPAEAAPQKKRLRLLPLFQSNSDSGSTGR